MNKKTTVHEKMSIFKQTALQYLEEQEVEKIWNTAEVILDDLHKRYPQIALKEMVHADSIFVHIALYKALLKKKPHRAMEIMEKGMATTAMKKAKFFQRMVKIPFGRAIFLKGFAIGCKTGFGEEAGFANVIHKQNRNVFQMDVTACPYAKYCRLEGCPELTHIFCENDDYAYGDLKGIRFIRTQTLGSGGEKCDFLLEKWN